MFLCNWGISNNCTQLPYFSPVLSTKPLNSLQTKLPPVVSVRICFPFFGGGKQAKKEEYLSVAFCILLYFEKQKASAGISFKLKVYLC